VGRRCGGEGGGWCGQKKKGGWLEGKREGEWDKLDNSGSNCTNNGQNTNGDLGSKKIRTEKETMAGEGNQEEGCPKFGVLSSYERQFKEIS